jgi:hypothetical protein
MAVDVPTISAIAGSISAFCAAISAAINLFNTRTFLRQLQNSTIDACLAACHGLKSSVYRTIELKERQGGGEDVKDSEISTAYEEAWTKWVVFTQTFQVARRYSPRLDSNTPSKISADLYQLRTALKSGGWKQETDRIKADVEQMVGETATELGATLV